MKGSVARKETLTYRWFRLGILLGVGLAILLLVNSVANYFLGSRRVLVEQRRRDLASQVASLDRQIQQASPESIPALGSLLEQVRQSSHGKIAWIQICNLEGAAVASAGPARSSTAGDSMPEHRRQANRGPRSAFDTELAAQAA